MPGTVVEDLPPKRTMRPQVIIPKNGHANNSPVLTPNLNNQNQQPQPPRVRPLNPIYETAQSPSTSELPTPTTTKNPQQVIIAAHPQDNEIAGSVNIR